VGTYLGRRTGRSGKLFHAVRIDGEERDRWYKNPPNRWTTPGTRFRFSFDTDGALFLTGDSAPVNLGQLEEDIRAELWALDRAAEAEHAVYARTKKERSDNELTRLLEGLRQEMRRRDRRGRAAIIATIIEELSK
jgi:hypothetical protein